MERFTFVFSCTVAKNCTAKKLTERLQKLYDLGGLSGSFKVTNLKARTCTDDLVFFVKFLYEDREEVFYKTWCQSPESRDSSYRQSFQELFRKAITKAKRRNKDWRMPYYTLLQGPYYNDDL